jgi:hypothetical protein
MKRDGMSGAKAFRGSCVLAAPRRPGAAISLISRSHDWPLGVECAWPTVAVRDEVGGREVRQPSRTLHLDPLQALREGCLVAKVWLMQVRLRLAGRVASDGT